MMLKGVGASSGIGIGKAVLILENRLDFSKVEYSGKENEKARLRRGISLFAEKTHRMEENVKACVGEKEAEILAGQIMMLNDPYMTSRMDEAIDEGQSAEAALNSVCNSYIEMFSGVDDELMRQRATDIQDIRTRMLKILLDVEDTDISGVPAGSVLVAKDITPSMTVGIKKENVTAFLTEVGGKTSHSAILARALEIPAVLGISGLMNQIHDGDTIIVDGGAGTVIAGPDHKTMASYWQKQEKERKEKELLEAYREKETVNADGNRYHLYANIGTLGEIGAAAASGAEGIGLFRTEFLFMDRSSLPTEEEQFDVYSEVSEQMRGKEVIIRTLDIGGDKDIPYMQMEKEENPFLGNRAIRYCLERPDIFSLQLRALLRAGAKNKNIKVMLPLVTGVDEVRAARALLEKQKNDLKREGIPYDRDIKVGVMIETPAAALIADMLAKEADFFSIGTNDLAQYTLAVDRGNAKVEKLYTAFHPAVLRSIRGIISAGKTAGIPVGMCGEAAADRRMLPLLIAFGLEEFSVSPSALLKLRKLISGWPEAEAIHVAEEVFQFWDSTDIENYLKNI